eukprot:TRINITY_DN18028_c0_g1_i1.p1 TRINITY_DN18028_c0_g1~~TRINITY_DN18028_c0_g1_i1.p1  ORF type:complete len:283 (+),score=84.17 TRINITY_DN18028_c0_g1_i1:91-849(+)
MACEIQLFALTGGGEKLFFELPSMATVADLHAQVAAHPQGPKGEFELHFHGQRLDPGTPFADAGVSSEAVLTIVELGGVVKYDQSLASNHVVVSDDGATIGRTKVSCYGTISGAILWTRGVQRWGCFMENVTDNTNVFVGIAPDDVNAQGHTDNGSLLLQSSGTKYPAGADAGGHATLHNPQGRRGFVTGDWLACELDVDARTFSMWRNGALLLTATALQRDAYRACVEIYSVQDCVKSVSFDLAMRSGAAQ